MDSCGLELYTCFPAPGPAHSGLKGITRMLWARSVASCLGHYLEMPCLPWGTRSGVKPLGQLSRT